MYHCFVLCVYPEALDLSKYTVDTRWSIITIISAVTQFNVVFSCTIVYFLWLWLLYLCSAFQKHDALNIVVTNNEV